MKLQIQDRDAGIVLVESEFAETTRQRLEWHWRLAANRVTALWIILHPTRSQEQERWMLSRTYEWTLPPGERLRAFHPRPGQTTFWPELTGVCFGALYSTINDDSFSLTHSNAPFEPEPLQQMAAQAEIIICGWGRAAFLALDSERGLEHRRRVAAVHELLWLAARPVFCLGMSARGEPMAPESRPRDTQLSAYTGHLR